MQNVVFVEVPMSFQILEETDTPIHSHSSKPTPPCFNAVQTVVIVILKSTCVYVGIEVLCIWQKHKRGSPGWMWTCNNDDSAFHPGSHHRSLEIELVRMQALCSQYRHHSVEWTGSLRDAQIAKNYK